MSEPKKKEGIVVFFNKEKFVAPKEVMSGAELREFFSVPAENKLYKVVPGEAHPDMTVTPKMEVPLKNGDKFYDLPPGKVGLD